MTHIRSFFLTLYFSTLFAFYVFLLIYRCFLFTWKKHAISVVCIFQKYWERYIKRCFDIKKKKWVGIRNKIHYDFMNNSSFVSLTFQFLRMLMICPTWYWILLSIKIIGLLLFIDIRVSIFIIFFVSHPLYI